MAAEPLGEYSPVLPEAMTLRMPNPAYQTMSPQAQNMQANHCRALFRQAAELPELPQRRGPLYPEIAEAVRDTTAQLQALHPDLRTEHLIFNAYRDPDVTQELIGIKQSLSTYDNNELDRIGLRRLQTLQALGRRIAAEQLVAGPEIILEPRAFDVPPYCYQGDSYKSSSHSACFNACYRMAYAAITGEFLHEYAVKQGSSRLSATGLLSDDEYLRSFTTSAFRARHPGRLVTPLTFNGASLGMLSKVVRRIKEARPQTSAYCIVNLQTEKNALQSIWHTNVLLSADSESVTVHDPTDKDYGAAFRTLDSAAFHQRWAVALFRAHVVLAE